MGILKAFIDMMSYEETNKPDDGIQFPLIMYKNDRFIYAAKKDDEDGVVIVWELYHFDYSNEKYYTITIRNACIEDLLVDYDRRDLIPFSSWQDAITAYSDTLKEFPGATN